MNYTFFIVLLCTALCTHAAPKKQPDLQTAAKSDETTVVVPKLTTSKVTTPTSRTIAINNNIEQEMLVVHKWGEHSPTKFAITIDGKILEPSKNQQVAITDNKLVVQYEYSFAKGMYKAKKDVTFLVDPAATELNMSFSWNDSWRVLLDKATPKSIEKSKA